MRPLDELVIEYLSELSAGYFIRQHLVIVAIFIFGAILTDLLIRKDIMWIKRCTLAFPVGLSAFVIIAYIMLITGIPYTAATVTVATVLITALALVLLAAGKRAPALSGSPDRPPVAKPAYSGSGKLTGSGNMTGSGKLMGSGSAKHMLLALAAAVLVATVATSGIAPVSISNDTMYYFRRYPDAIVFYKGLRDQFDFFMTDTGLGSVAVDTLSALFGFGETFGIREFFHIDFIAFFGICVYERAEKKMDRKHAVIASVLITAFLAASTPFVILGHWALANMYFCEMFFIAAYNVTEDDHSSFYANALLMTALALFRIEGTLFVIWLVVCTSVFTGLGKETAKFVILPVTVLFGGYCLRLYTKYYVLDNMYTFLTPAKALILIGLLVVTGLFMIFVFPMLYKRFGKKLALFCLIMLVAGNLLMFVRDSSLYIGNLKAFYANLFRQSGWGMLPYFIIAMTGLLVAEYFMRRSHNKKPERISSSNLFNITMVVGFLLIVLAASYGRGDVLSEDVGDSGNRVLLQIVPLLVMMYSELFLDLFFDSPPNASSSDDTDQSV